MDKKIIKKFIATNKAFFSNIMSSAGKTKGSILVDLQSNNIFFVCLILKISSVISFLLGYDLIVISAIRTNSSLKDIIRSYGPRRIINSGCFFVNGFLKHFREVLEKGLKIKTGDDLVSLTVNEYRIGVHIYDAVLRRFGIPTIDQMNYYHRLSVITELSYFYGLLDYIEENKICFAVLPDNAYRGGIVSEILVQKSIPSTSGIDINGISIHKYESSEDYKHHCRTPDDEFVHIILNNPSLFLRAENYLAFRTSGQEKQHDTMRAYSSDKESINRSNLIKAYNVDPQKKIVLVMAHIFCDAPHSNPQMLFKDFKQWVINTCAHLAANPNVHFLVKDHPSTDLYNEQGTLKRILDEQGFGDRFVSQDINTESLIKSVDAMVTCGGTSGMEFPCYGVPVLLAAKPSYSTFPYVVCPQTKEDYYVELNRIHEYKKLTDDKIRMAKVVLFIIQSLMKVEKNEIGLGSQAYYMGCEFNVDLFLQEMIHDCEDGTGYAHLTSIMKTFLMGNYKNLIDDKKLLI